MGAAPDPRFRLGARVRVRDARPRGHSRTPGYVRGKAGIVVAVRGAFRNPEELAYGGGGLPLQVLYTVRFPGAELWGEGQEGDPVQVDLYGHWLEVEEEG